MNNDEDFIKMVLNIATLQDLGRKIFIEYADR